MKIFESKNNRNKYEFKHGKSPRKKDMPWKSCFGSIGTSRKSGPKQAQQTEKNQSQPKQMRCPYYIHIYLLTYLHLVRMNLFQSESGGSRFK